MVNDAIKNMCISRLETLSSWYDMEKKSPVMPYSLEEDLLVNFPGGLVFKGKFDKVEANGDGTVKVVDYKTGKPDKHVKAVQNCRDIESYECDGYYRQLVSYKLIFDKNKKKENLIVDSGRLQFLEPAASTVKKYDLEKGGYRDIDIELTDSMVEGLEDLIKKCWKAIKDLRFEKLSERDNKNRCARCEYDSICWPR